MSLVDCPALNQAASQASDLATGLQGQAMAQASQLQNQATQLQSQAAAQVAQLHAQAAQIHDQAMAQVAQLEGQAAQLQGQAVAQVAQLQTAAMGQVAQLQGQALAQVGELQTQALGQLSSLQGAALAQVGQLQDQAKAQLSQLQDKAKAQVGQMQDQAKAQVSNLQDQAKAQATQLQDQAKAQVSHMQDQAKAQVSNLQDQAKTQATQLHDQAKAQVSHMQDQAKAQVSNLQDQAKAQATQLHDQATSQVSHLQDQMKQMHDQVTSGQAKRQLQGMAMAQLQSHTQVLQSQAQSHIAALQSQAQDLRSHAMSHVTDLQNQARAIQSQAQAQVTAMQSKAQALQGQAMASAQGFRDQLTGMLAVPPAMSALMQEATSQPLPDKERAQESDLAPFMGDDDEDEEKSEDQDEGHGDGEEQEGEEQAPVHKKAMSMAEWLAQQMQQQLEAKLKRYIPSSGGGMPNPQDMAQQAQDMAQQAQDMDQQSIEDWARGQVQSHLAQLAQSIPPIPDPSQIPDLHPEAPPYDGATAGALAGFAQTNDMMQDVMGMGFLDAGSAGHLQELVQSFQDCASAIPPIDPSQLASMSVAGSMAKIVEQVRNQFGIDMLQQNIGGRLAQALSQARSLDIGQLRNMAAQRAAQWLPLASFANSLKLPLSGPGALQRIGQAANWVKGLDMPDSGMAQQKLGQMLSHMDNAAAIKRVLNVDPSAKGAGAALAPMLNTARNNAQQAMSQATGAARSASGLASQLSRSSLAQVAKIDRSQAQSLAIGQIRHAATPVLKSATPVLATLQSVGQATGRKVTMPGRGIWGRRS